MKIAIVTGASSGMGREFARVLAARDHSLEEIWLVGRNEKNLQKTAAMLPAAARCIPLDLSEASGIQKLQEQLQSAHATVAALVNAAGLGFIGDVAELSLSEHCQTIRVNCEALIAVTYLALPYMKRGSRILQLCSASAFAPQPGFAVYAASKACVERFSSALRKEVAARGITVTCVCPGPVNTAFFDTAERLHPMPAFKKASMADPRKVAGKAVRDAENGRAWSIYGFSMKAFFLAAKYLPHDLIMDMTCLLKNGNCSVPDPLRRKDTR